MSAEPAPEAGRVAAAVADELPGLALWSLVVTRGRGPTPEGVRERLLLLDGRWRGADALLARRRPVPNAYRVLFHHVGLDPDAQPTPAEQAVRDRLVRGTFHSGDRLADALTLAVVETGVPLVALDAAAVESELELRAAGAGERLGRHELPPGRLVLAAGDGPVAVLFGEISFRHVPGRRARRVRLVAVQAPGVPPAHVAEALWLAAEALA